jgi:hypothetical protein
MPSTNFTLDEARQVLTRTPSVLNALLGGLHPDWTEADEGPDTWSPRVVLGHLIHGEKTDWIPRAKIILAGDESAEFEPFDRFAQLRNHRGTPVPDLLSEFGEMRAANLATLDGFGLGERDLARRARHPAFGPVTLGQLLSTWVVHDLGHVAQISRTMSKRYAADVGPWRAYLPVLTR